MKKIIVILFIVTIVFLVSSGDKKIMIPDNAIRFRIIANSNSNIDQNKKKELKEEIAPLLYTLGNNKNKDQVIKNINSNISKIENIVKKYTDNYDINYGNNYFPEKEYNNVVYKEGNYESLVITLGEGLGDNWWCVLFPPLCLIDAKEDELDDITYSLYLKEILNKFSI